MVRIFTALVLTAAAATPAASATRNYGVSGFDRIEIEGPYKVQLTTGVAPFARATGSQAGIDRLVVKVEGRTLRIRANRSAWGGYPGAVSGPVEIAVGTHDLSSAGLNGAGSLAIDKVRGLDFALSVQGTGSAAVGSVAVDQLTVNLVGVSSAQLAGTAPKLTATVRGAGALDAAALAVKDATIGAEGSVTVSANVSGSAKIQAMGTTAITLAGRPSCAVKASGSAAVSGCR